MQLPLTMQLSPDVCTLKNWISPPRFTISPPKVQETPINNLSPLLTKHTSRKLPLSRCSPWKYAMKCKHACLKSFQV